MKTDKRKFSVQDKNFADDFVIAFFCSDSNSWIVFYYFNGKKDFWGFYSAKELENLIVSSKLTELILS